MVPDTALGELDGDPALEVAAGTPAGRVYGLDDDGSPLAAQAVFLPDQIVGVAAVEVTGGGGNELVAASRDGTVMAVNPRASNVLWSVSLEGRAVAIAAGPGRVAVAMADGQLIGLDASTGAERWESPAGSPLTAVVHLPRAALLASGDQGRAGRFFSPSGDLAGEDVVADSVTSLAVGDLDGDGPEEVIVAAGYSFSAFGVEGGFRWETPIGQPAAQAAVGDIDGDGRGDVVG